MTISDKSFPWLPNRYHAVQEFNRGVFNYLIATDESGLEGIEKDSDDEESDTEEPARKLTDSFLRTSSY